MRLLQLQAAIGTAILLSATPADAKHDQLSHLGALRRHNHKKSQPSPRVESNENESHDGLKSRGGSCAFPTDASLVAVTPGSMNAGWAMSPDQTCEKDSYCPYACPPGQLMAQWSPEATSYTYPQSMAGGLYCDSKGAISKPYPNKPYCVDGTGSIAAKNNCGKTVAFCQTVLPGNEAMLIPTSVSGTAGLAVPDTSYWCSTAAHYYINAPGLSTDDACIWGDGTKPLGNWSPYVAGANTDSSGETFVKIGWNPIYTDSDFVKTTPSFGVKIECGGSGCNGTPCSIDPSVVGVGGVTSADKATGAGGADFCVVTVPKGQTANIVVFDTGSASGSSGTSVSTSVAVAAKVQAVDDDTTTSETPTPIPTPTPTPEPTKTAEPPTSTTSTEESTSSSTPPTTSSTSAKKSTTSFSSTSVSSLTVASTTSSETSSSASSSATADNSPHVFFENTNSTVSSSATKASSSGAQVTNAEAIVTSTSTAPVATTSKKSSAPVTNVSGSMFSFLVLFAFASYML